MGIKRSTSMTSTAPPLSLVILSCLCVVGSYSYSSSHADAATTLVSGADTMTQGQEMKDNDYLISPDETFRLGFYTPSYTKNRYLAIWYNKIGERTVVWVANRNNPILDNSGALTIDGNGNLKITYGGLDLMVSNSNQSTSSNVTATLLDCGNFVLRFNGSVLWQSFDHPTNTLLPGMKLGMNLKTGQNWSLTTWLSHSVPFPGAFTLGGNPNGTKQLVMWRQGAVYWTSGVWDTPSSDFIPAINQGNEELEFKYISNEEETYFTFTLKKNSSFPHTILELSPNGMVMNTTYALKSSSSAERNIMISCDGLRDGGCVGEELKCPTGDRAFDKKNGYMTEVPYEEDQNPYVGMGDCNAKCRSNCSCIAFASVHDNGTGCRLWSGGFSVSSDRGLIELYVLDLGENEGSHQKAPKGGKRWWVWFIIAVATTIAILLFCFLCYLRKYSKPKGGKETSEENLSFELGTNLAHSHKFININELKKEGKKGHELEIFSLVSIMNATNNFSLSNMLGEGGFGPVYKTLEFTQGSLFKGVLPDGQEIAVKRLSRSSVQGLMEFKNEILLIAKLQHMNLVRLLGCCLQAEENILIYEYMRNKSLDYFLYDPIKRKLLDWKKRFNIIEGITQGLLYLHKYSRLRIIHRDLKASNILLDDEMNPKISDFGMARIFGRNESKANTNRVIGTYGYMSPEYAMEGIFSVKSDVYSFGVLLLEIVSGSRSTSFHNNDRSVNLTRYAWDLWKEGTIFKLVDPMLGDSFPLHEFSRYVHVGLLCIQDNATDRPTISDVASMLMNETMPLPSPKQPAYSFNRNLIERDLPESENYSRNNLSISVIEAR